MILFEFYNIKKLIKILIFYNTLLNKLLNYFIIFFILNLNNNNVKKNLIKF